MSLPRVFVANPQIPKIAHDMLQNVATVVTTAGFDKKSILEGIKGADALLWPGRIKLDKEVLDAAGPQLKVVGAMSAGYNHIDLSELKARGIKLGNASPALGNTVADMAILLALAAARRFTEGRKHMEEGTWSKQFNPRWMMGQDVADSTIGIIGLGSIGQAIAKRMKAFDVGRIIYVGRSEKKEGKELGAEYVTLDTLIKESDFIFVAAPLDDNTRHMCNASFFAKMKKTSVFVNVSRGELVDQDALIKALKTNQIFAAGLDVMTPEPINPDNELLRLPNAVLTPHIASSTEKTRIAMAKWTAENIIRGLKGEELLTPVQL
ncbi:hypothetical protein GWI33_000338 [Rhynchophorus ferrugineus]|uniref:Glyoxylate reductase/hydroxypyruvate reductase n=1 Tax=Rhynchophorus ferrugineus TaxID=354439 RepID=A0A834IP14_RHYFE|nr:hypothetical protein GWI33_000338 [Rhynchophorus ferrugineus]